MFGSLFTVASGWLLKLGSTKLLEKVGDFIGKGQDAKAELALKQIDAEIEARKNATVIRVATAGFWEMRFITFCIAGIFTLHLVAVGLDTVFGFGWGIAKFPAPFDEWEGVILLSFFGVQVAMKAINTTASILMKWLG